MVKFVRPLLSGPSSSCSRRARGGAAAADGRSGRRRWPLRCRRRKSHMSLRRRRQRFAVAKVRKKRGASVGTRATTSRRRGVSTSAPAPMSPPPMAPPRRRPRCRRHHRPAAGPRPSGRLSPGLSATGRSPWLRPFVFGGSRSAENASEPDPRGEHYRKRTCKKACL